MALLRPASHAALLRPTARPAVTMAGFGAPPAQGGKKVKKGGKSGAKSKSGGPPAKELLPKKQWTVYRELLKEDALTAGVYAKDVEDEVRVCLVCSGQTIDSPFTIFIKSVLFAENDSLKELENLIANLLPNFFTNRLISIPISEYCLFESSGK